MEQKASAGDVNPSWVRQPNSLSLRLENRPKPEVKGDNDVLIEVKAASVNPIDIKINGGYGDVLLTFGRKLKRRGISSILSGAQPGERIEVLGRDFSGIVVAVGDKVEGFIPGDEVVGATSPILEGSHAHYTIASDNDICKKPSNLSHIEAASIPYVALTFLAAFHSTGATADNMNGKRVHLNAAAGGVGSFALQYLKAVGCDVTVSVSKSAAEVIAKFNPDHILDYQSPNYQEELQKLDKFDVAFDFAGDESAMYHVKPKGWFVTVITTMMRAMDSMGIVLGGLYAATLAATKKAQVRYNCGVYYQAAMFTQNRQGLEEMRALIEDGKIKPLVEQVFSFDELPEAYEKVGGGKGRGKVVIDVAGSQ